MKLIGIVGGLSWEATALYYRLLNEATMRELGPHHNARSVIVSVDFAEALALANQDDWDGLAVLLIDAAIGDLDQQIRDAPDHTHRCEQQPAAAAHFCSLT